MSRQHPVARSFSPERIKTMAAGHGWTIDQERADRLIIRRSAADGRRRIIVWLMSDGRIRSAYHEFGNGRYVMVEGGLANVLWHLVHWADVHPQA